MKKLSIVTALLFSLMLTSCVTLKSCVSKPPPDKPDPLRPGVTTDIPKQVEAIQSVRTATELGVSGIKTEAAGIKSDTTSGRKEAPKAPQWDFIDKKADLIIQISDVVDKKVKDLNTASAELTVAEAERKRQEEFIKQSQKILEEERVKSLKLEEDVKSLTDGAKKQQQIIWRTVSAFAALGLVIGIFLFIYAKSELGISLSVSSLILACISYFMAAYALIVAVVGGLILLAVICYLIWHLFQHKVALKETVKNFEEIKHKEWNDPGVKDKVSFSQSPSTKKIVHEIRMEEGLK
jgi:ElaB/YqjD/DUF883 family membrane-anchored ribosome-binding protein